MSSFRSPVAALLAVVGLLVAAGAAWWMLRPKPSPWWVVVHDPRPADTPQAAPDHLPDVIVVIGCTVRIDQLPMFGGPDTTPHLASLAEQGALFTDAITAAPWTRPASVALLTGQHAVSVGMVEPGPDRDSHRLPREVTTLASHLRGVGFHTVGGTANPNLNAVYGFDQGFDAYVQMDKLWKEGAGKLDGPRLLLLMSREVEQAPPDVPLYLQVMLVDAHAPYDAPEEEVQRFAEDDLPENVAAYRAGLRRFDQALAEARALQAARGRPALLVVVNDHGEGLGWPRHHGKAHGRYLAPSAVGGLWLMQGPGVGEGVRVDGLASQVDLVPTVLGTLGLSGYAGPGIDHSDRLRQGGTTTRDAAFSDTWFLNVDRAAIYTRSTACQQDFGDAETKRFVSGCFDRAEDPDHAAPYADPALQARLQTWRSEREAELAAWLRGDGRQAVDTPEELADQLEALGYLER